MYIQPLTTENVSEFIQYCNKYGKEHDESYLPDENFEVSSGEPCYLLYNQANELIGAASLIIGKKRFRIFHSIIPELNNYKCLLDNIMTKTNGLDNMYLFIPENKLKVRDILKDLDFDLQRYTWYLERDNADIDNVELSNDIQITELELNQDEKVWAEIVNDNFVDHQGFTNLQVEDVQEMMVQNNDNYTKLLIMRKDNKPIGTIHLEIEIEDGIKMGYISWLSIDKSYRGLGLGRTLLKYAIQVASTDKVDKVGLVVHSTNDKALQLYRSEGFKNIQSLVCYNKQLG